MVIVIFRCPVPLGKEEATVRAREGSHAGQDVERGAPETPSKAFKVMTSFVRITQFTYE